MLDRAAAKPAARYGNRDSKQAKVGGEVAPDFRSPSTLGMHGRATGLEAVTVAQIGLEAVA